MSENAYKAAGVDIEAGESLVQRIRPHVKNTQRPGVMGGIGGFGAIFDVKSAGYQDPLLVSSTDGVGTKIKIAIDTGNFTTIGIDLVAMCVNDLLVQGAEPLFFLDYYATGQLDVSQAEQVIQGIAKGCEQAGCALTGGETAEMPGLYQPGDFDLAGFTVGAVERDQLITGQDVQEGDVLLGLGSNGLHANGFSLVRKLVQTAQDLSYEAPVPFESPANSIGQALLTPTRIYVKPVLALISAYPGQVHAMAHITGGGLVENIPRVIPEGLCAEIDAASWNIPPVFQWLCQIGDLSAQDLAQTLNLGIGFVLIVAPESVEGICRHFEKCGERVRQIGSITARSDSKVQISGLE